MASKAIGFLNFKFLADVTSFERAMNKAQKKLKKVGKSVTKTGQNLSRNLTLPIIGLGASALKTFADFEQGMLKVKAISGATNSEFKALTDSAKELGSTTMFTASQVAELQLNLSKLGFDPQSILDSSQAILNLAQATDSDLAEAATVAASTMNAFGLEAKDMTMISDVMADAFSSSALDLQKFQTAMAAVAPVAKQAGQDIQGTSAILGVLVNNGIEASTAGTALRNIFLDLADQGMTWDEAMQQIQGSLNPLQTAMDMFGKRGASVASIIANNGTEIQKLTADFNDSAGEAQKMADTMDSGVGGAFRKLQSQLEGAGIELGEKLVPIFTKFGEKLKALIKLFTDLSPQQQENIVKYAAIFAAVGPVIWILGKLILTLGFLAGVLKFLALNPFARFLTVITAVVGAVWYFATSTSNVAVKVRNVFIGMVNGLISAINMLIKAFNTVSEAVGGRTISEINTLKKETYQAAESMGELGDAAETTTNQLSTLEQVTEAVNKSTKTEIDNAGQLIATIKNGESSRTEQIKALKELKKISPEYFGELKIGVSSLEDIMLATEDYTTSLKNLAKIEFVAAQTKPLYGDLLEAEMALRKFKETAIDEFGDPDNDPFAQQMIDRHSEQYLFNIDKIQAKINEYNATLADVGKTAKKSLTGTGGTTRSVGTGGTEDKKVKQMEFLSLDTNDTFEEISLLSHRLDDLEMPENLFNTDPMDKYRGALGMLGDQIATFIGTDIKSMEEAMATYAEQLGNNLAQGAESFKEYGNTVKGIMKEVIGSMISAGVAAAVKTALESIPPFPGSVFLIPALAGAAAGLARTAFNSLIPSFEDGGIISGPTVGLMGEYPGASSNPEVVAPLDKLKSMIGGGSQNIIVEGVLKGNDIYLSNKNTSINRLRTT